MCCVYGCTEQSVSKTVFGGGWPRAVSRVSFLWQRVILIRVQRGRRDAHVHAVGGRGGCRRGGGARSVQPDGRTGNSATLISRDRDGEEVRNMRSSLAEPGAGTSSEIPATGRKLRRNLVSCCIRGRRSKWRLHQRVQCARLASTSASAMWCVEWRRDDPRRPCISSCVCVPVCDIDSNTGSMRPRDGYQLFGVFRGMSRRRTQGAQTDYVLHLSR